MVRTVFALAGVNIVRERIGVGLYVNAMILGGWYSMISLHGGGSPEAMKREIWRNYPVMDRVALVERLLDRDVLDRGQRVSKQPGRCCATGCEVPDLPAAAE